MEDIASNILTMIQLEISMELDSEDGEEPQEKIHEGEVRIGKLPKDLRAMWRVSRRYHKRAIALRGEIEAAPTHERPELISERMRTMAIHGTIQAALETDIRGRFDDLWSTDIVVQVREGWEVVWFRVPSQPAIFGLFGG